VITRHPRIATALAGSLATVFVVAFAGPAVGQCAGVPTFSATVAHPLPGPLKAIDNADLDGDGALDLVVTDGAQIVILRNVVGGFVSQPAIAAPANVSDLVIGDFDEDGRPDIAATGSINGGAQGAVSIFLNRTSGTVVTFLPPSVIPFGGQLPAPTVGLGIKTGDLNADGILDLAISELSFQNAWVVIGQGSFGLGDGSFAAPIPYPVTGNFYTDLAIADFNQDGAPDLALLRYYGTIQLLAGILGPNGLPTGTFANAGVVALGATGSCYSIESVDVDADGLVDLVTGAYLNIEVAYGGGGFAFTVTPYPSGTLPTDIAVGDFSGDGVVDVAACREVNVGSGNGNFSVLVGQAAGGFTGYTNLAFNTGHPNCITSGDWNGDTYLDVATGKGAGGVDVRYGGCVQATGLSINVISPNGGETHAAGSSTVLSWSKSASVALVDVLVSHDGGTTWQVVAESVAGTSHPWFVTNPATTNARIRVTATGVALVTDMSNGPFTITGIGAAAAIPIGSGCSPLGAPPSLSVAPPILGSGAQVTVQGGAPAVPGGLWLGLVPASPAVVAPGCSAFLDLGTLTLATGFTTNVSGAWNSTFAVPSVNGLVGIVFRAQSAIILAGTSVQLTNAMELTFGF
jgi:hypothetical protein